ncbi:calcium-dependent phosphotriesterase [Pseudohyphozyma bogoriensis]|nr:calcium-dependent phosphotriesterase [Pseudohyphozyma bogoriensis]
MRLKEAFVVVTGIVVAYSGFPSWAWFHLVPPPLPLFYYSLSLSTRHLPIPSVNTVLVTGASGSSSPLKYCEDATEWETSKGTLLILSCDPGRKSWNTVMGPLRDPAPRGVFWVVDPAEEVPRGRELALAGFPDGSDFHPLGIKVWHGGNGGHSTSPDTDTLFVINHQRHASTIEVFSLASSLPSSSDTSSHLTTTYIATLSHPSFIAPNALALTSSTSFYLTQDHRFTRRDPSILGTILNLVETVAALPLGRVDHVTFGPPAAGAEAGTDDLASKPAPQPRVESFVAASGIPFANGVVLSSDGGVVAVASSTKRHVRIYDRDVLSNELTLDTTIAVPFHVDNLSLAPRSYLDSSINGSAKGDVFIAAGHPHYFSLLATARNKTMATRPLSWVAAISPRYGSASSTPSADDDELAPYPATKRASSHPAWEVKTLFQSHGRGEGGFGMSTTGVVGTSAGKRWLAVCGLYEDGLLLARES